MNPSSSETHFTPPVKDTEVLTIDDRLTSCSLLIRDALDKTFSLLVQTQSQFSTELIREPFVTDETVEPVFMVPNPQLTDDVLNSVVYGTAPALLQTFLVPQSEGEEPQL